MATERTGNVVAFDDRRGWGQIRSDDGAVVDFHCTQLADGTRTIRAGTAVRYEIGPGALGTWEAVRIRTS